MYVLDCIYVRAYTYNNGITTNILNALGGS